MPDNTSDLVQLQLLDLGWGVCKHCGEKKPWNAKYFRIQRNGKPYRTCLDCHYAKQRERYATDDEYRERRLWHDRKYRVHNREKINERSRRYHANNREAHKLRCRKANEKNKEKRKQYLRENADHVRAVKRKWYLKNRKKILRKKREKRAIEANRIAERKRAKKRRDANPHKSRAKTARRRALKQSLPGKYSAKDIDRLLRQQGFRCAYCASELLNVYEVDHIIPITRNNTSNYSSNLVVTCVFCNRSKGDKLLREWRPGLVDKIAALKGCDPDDLG